MQKSVNCAKITLLNYILKGERMKFYNTLTGKKEEFTTQDGTNTVRMYSCGLTVYNFAHIGNLRTYVFMDMLRRALRYNGYDIKGVMNITDVGHLVDDGDDGEDKMAKTAKEQKKDPYAIAKFYTDAFLEDFKRLNIGLPEIICKATDHIKEMEEFVKILVDKGYGYETSDGIYFDISRFPQYGMLSGAKTDPPASFSTGPCPLTHTIIVLYPHSGPEI